MLKTNSNVMVLKTENNADDYVSKAWTLTTKF